MGHSQRGTIPLFTLSLKTVTDGLGRIGHVMRDGRVWVELNKWGVSDGVTGNESRTMYPRGRVESRKLERLGRKTLQEESGTWFIRLESEV